MGKKSTSTTTNRYGKTTTVNPYATAKTTNAGTVTNLNDGTALSSVYNFVNNNIDSLLNDYLTPNIDSVTNQAKLNAFRQNLNSESMKNLENNIISPLSKRNMLRSSQATDLYKNLSESNNDSISSYINQLIADSQNNTASMINDLLKNYLQAYSVVSDTQNQSLRTSQGNSTRTTSSSGGSNYLDTALKLISMAAK